jgi:adenine C2-methylase RlmN of 23S rRNA A2503 and tRNA A37
LLPANKRFGGLEKLMQSLQDYITMTKGNRLTLEWALIEGKKDTAVMAHKLGMVKKWLRRDMIHVNINPLNPTGGTWAVRWDTNGSISIVTSLTNSMECVYAPGLPRY